MHSYTLPQSLDTLDRDAREPPLPSSIMPFISRRSQSRPRHIVELRFSDVVWYFLSSTSSFEPGSPIDVWLSAFIYVKTAECNEFFDLVTDLQQRQYSKHLTYSYTVNDPEEMLKGHTEEYRLRSKLNHIHLWRANLLNDSVRTSVAQAIALRARFAIAGQANYTDAVRKLSQLAAATTDVVNDIKQALEVEHQIRSIAASEAAISDRGSALARKSSHSCVPICSH